MGVNRQFVYANAITISANLDLFQTDNWPSVKLPVLLTATWNYAIFDTILSLCTTVLAHVRCSGTPRQIAEYDWKLWTTFYVYMVKVAYLGRPTSGCCVTCIIVQRERVRQRWHSTRVGLHSHWQRRQLRLVAGVRPDDVALFHRHDVVPVRQTTLWHGVHLVAVLSQAAELVDVCRQPKGRSCSVGWLRT